MCQVNHPFPCEDRAVITTQSQLEKSINLSPGFIYRHKQVMSHLAHFAKDIKTHKATITAFEVGSRCYLTKENEQRLINLLILCERNKD